MTRQESDDGVCQMNTETIDLYGKVCPYPVVDIVRCADRLRSGETLRCLVDDPLAIKSVPEELEDYPDVSVSINACKGGWEITVARE